LKRFASGAGIPTSQSETTEMVQNMLTPQGRNWTEKIPIVGGDVRARRELWEKGDKVAAMIPFYGPAERQMEERYRAGDKAGAAGAGVNALLSLLGIREAAVRPRTGLRTVTERGRPIPLKQATRDPLAYRVNKIVKATGPEPGIPAAARATLPDLAQTGRQLGLKFNTIDDLAKAVEETNKRINTHLALAEQPFAGDMVLTKSTADALRAAVDNLPPSAATEAAELRAEASNWEKPISLRDLGREVRQQNDLYRKHSGKTSLELSTAKTRASVAANDILRKTLRDNYVDYLESKYHDSGIHDLRLRQEQILKLRETLGEYNPRTGVHEKGRVEKLHALHAEHKGSAPVDFEDLHSSISARGAHGYLRLPKALSRSPKTVADAAVRKAFHDTSKSQLPTREFKPLVPKEKPPEAEPAIEAARRGASGEPPAPERDVNTRAQVSDRVAEAKRRTESLKRQAAVAGTKHPEWAERIRAAEAKADAAAKSGGDPEAARLKELAKPAGDTGHLATATEELFPGRKFHELSPAEQSRAIQKSLEHKFGESKKPSATTESKPSPLDPYETTKFTPEQKAEWSTAQKDYESGLRHAESWRPHDPQRADAMRKAAGMRFAAEKRRISGKLTTKEALNKAKYEASFHRGKKVTVRGQSGEVVGMSFGKVRVRMDDGKVISANQEDVEDFKP
jgi:hypothetical protein